MRLRSLTTALALSALPLLHVVPAEAAPYGTPSAFEREILNATNAERARHGLRGFGVSTCATYYAQRWSRQMAATRTMSHQNIATVMSSCHGTAAAENVGYGRVTATQLVAMWMRSSTHRANILSTRYNRLGVGATRLSNGTVYATEDFLRLP